MTSLLRYASAYLLWLVTMALGVVAAMTVRTAYQLALATTNWDRFAISAIDRFAVVFLVLLLIVLLVLTESYYRTGVEQGELLRRFARMTAIQLGILIPAYFISWWLISS